MKRAEVYKTGVFSWTCPLCEYKNLETSTYCRLCDAAQPAPEAPESRSRVGTSEGTGEKS